MVNEPVAFTIDVEGESGTRWAGKFKAKPRLTHREQLRRDALRREYLGANPDTASPRAIQQSIIFAEIHTRLIEWPKWWENEDFGFDLADDAPIKEIYEAVMRIEKDALTEITKKAEEAKKALATLKTEE